MEKQQKYYVCKRLRVLGFLAEQGFTYDFALPDMRDPQKLNWFFVKTDELKAALEKYYSRQRERGFTPSIELGR